MPPARSSIANERHGRFLHRVVAVGGPSAIHELVNVLHRERYVGYEIVGACVPDHLMGDANDVPVPVMGTPDEARRVCEATGADTVLIAGGSFASSADLRRVGWQLERSDIDLVVIPSLADIAGPRIHLRPVAGLPLMHVEPPQADAAGRWSKRLFDIVGACFALLVFSPLMLVVAALIKLEDGGPVFFRQIRIGRDGQAFQCFKFRSMCIDAEERRADLHEHNEADGVLFKMQNDPAGDAHRQILAPLLARRAAAALQRGARHDEPGRTATTVAGGGRRVWRRRPPPPAGAARHDWALAGVGALSAELAGNRSARPVLRRQLVDGQRPDHPAEDHARGRRIAWRLLIPWPSALGGAESRGAHVPAEQSGAQLCLGFAIPYPEAAWPCCRR